MDDIEIVESDALASITPMTGRRWKARLIEGDRLGSTGYYPAETLRRDGPKVFPKGTPIYLNHPTPRQHVNGGVSHDGLIQDFAGELAEDAYYDGDGLYAEIEVFEHQAPLIKSLSEKIGISIRARGRSEVSVIDGKQVPVFKELVLGRSVDFVRRAGAGGKLVQILESATDNEEGTENMDEVLEALTALKTASEEQNTALSARLTAIEESLATREEVKTEEETQESAKEVDFDAVIAMAQELAESALDTDGRARVLELHRANGKPLAELITAEESYVKKTKKTVVDDEGIEENLAEVEESFVPRAWKTK